MALQVGDLVTVRYLEQAVGQQVMGVMRGIKSAFDPKGLLNPGKVCMMD